VELVEDLDNALDRVAVLALVAQLALIARDLSNSYYYYPEESEYSEALRLYAILVETDTQEDNDCIKEIELVEQVGAIRCEGLKHDFSREDPQEDPIDERDDIYVEVERVGQGQVLKDEDGVGSDVYQ